MSDRGFVSEIASNRLQSLEGFLVPALVQNNVRDADRWAVDKHVALRRMIANAFNTIAVHLDFKFWLKNKRIIVNPPFSSLQIYDIDASTEVATDNWILVIAEVTADDWALTVRID